MKRYRRRFAIGAAGLLPLALLMAVTLAAAGQATGPDAVQESSSILVPAAEFVDEGLTAFDFAYDEPGGYTYLITDTLACMQAPVYLPDGATVNSFGGYVYDDDPAGRIRYIELRRVSYLPGAATNSEVMAETSTANEDAAAVVVFAPAGTLNFALVDTSVYVYYAVVCMDGGPGDILRLYAVEATYSQ